jgi:hypothetical protein
MSPPSDEPTILRDLAGGGRGSLVFQTRSGPALGATRYFLRPVERGLASAIERRVLAGGPTAGLRGDLVDALEGYRVRAALGPLPGLPAMTGAGIARSVPPGMPALAAAYGYPYVTAEWIEGSPLVRGGAGLPATDRLGILTDLLTALAALHGRGVALGRIETSAARVAGGRGWWIKMGGLSQLGAPDRDAALAADVAAFARLAASVLAAAPAGPADQRAWQSWSSSIEAYRRGTAAAASAAELARILDLPEPEPRRPETMVRDTIVVSDGPLMAAPAPATSSTVFVPDAVDLGRGFNHGAENGPVTGEERHGSSARALAIAAAILAIALAIATLWMGD